MKILPIVLSLAIFAILELEALPPIWVQKLIESKSGFTFDTTTTVPPIIVYTATVIRPHPPKPEVAKPTPYPYWKWKTGLGNKSPYYGGKGKYGKKGGQGYPKGAWNKKGSFGYPTGPFGKQGAFGKYKGESSYDG